MPGTTSSIYGPLGMLWHKAWLETRGRFLGGLALSLIVGFGVIYDFRATERLLPLVRNLDPSALDTSGPLGAAIKESLAAQQTFRGFVWWQMSARATSTSRGTCACLTPKVPSFAGMPIVDFTSVSHWIRSGTPATLASSFIFASAAERLNFIT